MSKDGNKIGETRQEKCGKVRQIIVREPREPLKIGFEVWVKGGDRREYCYVIDEVLSETGATCICYKAHRREDADFKVLLKEYYPNYIAGIRRDAQTGELRLPENEEQAAALQSFAQSIERIRQFLRDNELAPFISAPEDFEELTGNGSVFCVNTYYDRGVIWSSTQADTVFDNLTCVLAIARFLAHLHENELAYVDMKEDNVLLVRDGIGELSYSAPRFFDFDSVLAFGAYPLNRIHGTYGMERFAGKELYWEEEDIPVRVDAAFDIRALGEVIRNKLMCLEWKDWPEGLKASCGRLANQMCSSPESLTMTEVIQSLQDIKEKQSSEGRKEEEEKLKNHRKQFDTFYPIIFLLTIAIYVGITVVYLGLVTNAEWILSHRIARSRTVFVLISVLFFMITLIAFGAKMFLFQLAGKLAASETACDAYDRDICVADQNLFLLGGRKNQTFQDKSASNRERQNWRRVLWLILGAGILAGFGLSLYMNSFPVLVVTGMIVLVAFMCAEFIPAERLVFREMTQVIYPKQLYPDLWENGYRTALYFKEEYDSSRERRNGETGAGAPFQLDSPFYQERGLNLCEIRKYAETHTVNYNTRVIRQTYKMAWDRLKNTQLVLNLVFLVISLLTAFLGISAFTGFLAGYFRIVDSYCFPITLAVVVFNGLVNCAQIATARRQEERAAHLAYYSRYVRPEFLAGALTEDIRNGVVLGIDISRGIFQYGGECTVAGSESYPAWDGRWENRVLLHHLVLSNSRRLAIAMGCTFAALFAVFVWQMHILAALPLAGISCAAVWWLGSRYVLYRALVSWAEGSCDKQIRKR